MKQYSVYLELMLAESAIQAANNRKTLVTDRILTRLRHIISLCKPLTGFPAFNYSIDLQRSKIKATKSKISICRWFPEGVGWEHVRYIDIPTVWLEESTADANIVEHLKAWLDEREIRRSQRRALAKEQETKKKIQNLISQAAALDPDLAEEIRKWKIVPKTKWEM